MLKLVRKRNRRAGFTLVELLVVISIIALLLSILMPSLQKARDSAKKVVCKSQLHDIGTAVFLYAADFNGNLLQPFTQLMKVPGRYDDPARWHIEDQDTDTFSTKMPFLLRIYTGDYLMNSYGIKASSWICPGLKKQTANLPNSIVRYIQKGQKGDFWYWPSNGVYPAGYFIGYANLMKLHNMTSGEPGDVEESPKKSTDRGTKHLLADLNLKWPDSPGDPGNVWTQAHSVVAHRAKGGVPAGGNRLYLDGHVTWIHPKEMGYKNEPLQTSEGKFDHAPSAIRDCYW